MDRAEITALVLKAIDGYRYEQATPGSTIGVTWSAEKMYDYGDQLRKAVVDPYQQQFELRESVDQLDNPACGVLWVVAEAGRHRDWYDPATGDFGLGQCVEGCANPISIGVRGDLVGVFAAM